LALSIALTGSAKATGHHHLTTPVEHSTRTVIYLSWWEPDRCAATGESITL
jgi:hypothetical protein